MVYHFKKIEISWLEIMGKCKIPTAAIHVIGTYKLCNMKFEVIAIKRKRLYFINRNYSDSKRLIYLKGSQRGEQRDRERCYICWFTLQMFATAWLVACSQQEPVIPCRSVLWVAGLSPLLLRLRCITRAWILLRSNWKLARHSSTGAWGF